MLMLFSKSSQARHYGTAFAAPSVPMVATIDGGLNRWTLSGQPVCLRLCAHGQEPREHKRDIRT